MKQLVSRDELDLYQGLVLGYDQSKKMLYYSTEVPVADRVTVRVTSDNKLEVTRLSGPIPILTQGNLDTYKAEVTAAAAAQVSTGSFLRRWTSNTFFAAGTPVLNPFGEIVTAKVDFTSGGTYSASNWNSTSVSLTYASKTDPAGVDFAGPLTVLGQPVAAPPEVLVVGNVGAAYTLNLAARRADLIVRATLTANHTMTITGATAGDRVTLLLTQDATGGRALTISQADGSQQVAVAPTPGSLSVLELTFDGTDVFISGGVSSGLAQTIVDAKGDLLVASANDIVGRLPVGSSGQLLRANSAAALGVEWATAQGLSTGAGTYNYVLTGHYYGPNGPAGGSARPQGLLEASPIYLPACSIDRLRIVTTTAGSTGSTVRLGIYADDGTGKPGALLLDAGTLDATTAAGSKEITVAQALTGGLYWLASVAQDSASVPTRHTVTTSGARIIPLPRQPNGTAWATGWTSPTTVNTGPLPSTFGAVTSGSLSGASGWVDVRVA